LTESIEIYRVTTMIRRHRSIRNFVSRFFVFPILDADPDRFVPLAERERRIFASIRGVTSRATLLRGLFSPDLGSGLRPLINASPSPIVRKLAALIRRELSRGCQGGVPAFQLNLVRDAPFKLSEQLHRGAPGSAHSKQ
jgi:hypothetical protein